MARRSPQTQAKRQREFDKAQKRRDKAEKRALRKAQKSGDAPAPEDAEATVAEATNADEPNPDTPQPDPTPGQNV